jgi:hypothetical protein
MTRNTYSRTDIINTLDNGSSSERHFMNYWAVAVIRQLCDDNGWIAATLLNDECDRFDTNEIGFTAYLKTTRTGSTYRLNRSQRAALWLVINRPKYL